MAIESHFIQTIIGVGILLFAAKLMAELFHRIKLPIVLGELLAGMIIGPFALGAFLVFDGTPLIQLDELRILGEIGAIVILFIAGLEITPKEFFRGGKASFIVGTCGVIVPFFVGFVVFGLFGFDAFQSMLIATALTATSIAISVQVLREFGKLQTPEARLIIGAAIVDDILAIAVLSVVSSLGTATGDIADINPMEIVFVILQVLGFFAALLIGAIVIIPRIVARKVWKAEGSIEAITTASFFGFAALAGSIGLSPIVGAFAVGMALSATNVFEKIERYISKLGLIFAPLFFAYIGAQVDFRGINAEILILSGVMIAVAVVTKLFGCGLPALIFLKNKKKSMQVGIGMISRGEVGLIVAGIGVASGVLTSDVYSTIIIMVAVSTIITPLWLKASYKKEAVSQQP
ncbi:MAG: cation:proton antiporter [Nitrosopumilaceae archaeon]